MKIVRMLLNLSSRNTLRNKRRTLLTMGILVLGSSGLILIGGFFIDLMDGFKEVFIHGQTGHLQVNAEGYYRKGATDPLNYLIPDVARAQAVVEETPHVLFTVPHLSFSGMASSSKANIGCLALGVDAEGEKRMGNFQTTKENAAAVRVVEGEDLSPSEPYGVLLGVGLLKALDLHVGDTFSFVTTRPGGALDGAQFRIRGTFTTFIKEFDDRAMKLNLEKAQAILGAPNKAQSLLVILDDTKNTDAVRADLVSRLKKGFPGMEVVPWHEMAAYYHQSKDLLNKIYVTIQLILMVVFVFSVGNTVNMAILERTREFGTMMAIGNPRPVVFGLIVLEGFLLGLIGAVAGALIGTGLAHVVSMIGIELTPPQAAQVYVTHVAVTPALIVQTLAVSVVSSTAASALPALRICRARIVEALGYV